MIWTNERCEQLRDGVAKGLSASQIAGEIGGITRNAVIGKVARLGLSLRGLDVGPRQPGRKASYGGEVREVALPPPPESPAEPLPESRLVTLDELNLSTDCRWPFGDPRSTDFRYCGAPRAWPDIDTASCYCGAHLRLAGRAA